MLEKPLRQSGSFLDVVPVSLYLENGKLKELRHEDKQTDFNPIAMRETLRSYIKEVVIDTNNMSLEILLHTSTKVSIQMRKTATRPIRYSYKTINTDWTEINVS